VGFGAAVASGGWAALLIDDPEPERTLGPALLWAEQAGADEIELWARTGAGDLARRAAYFATPPVVSHVQGTELAPAGPEPRRPLPQAPPEVSSFVALLREAGTTVVDDHGVVVGEFEGLEVARVVALGGEAWLEVGVGQADRQFEGAFHGSQSSVQRIRRVVDVVRQIRATDAALHPLNRLGRERWLRARLVAEPSLVGAVELTAAPPLRPRQGLRQHLPAPAVGVDAEGRAMVVVASVGIDLDLVPEAADLRDRHDPVARLVIAVPPRDRIPLIERLAARLRVPAELWSISPPWAGA
jgi:hypothetical protein